MRSQFQAFLAVLLAGAFAGACGKPNSAGTTRRSASSMTNGADLSLRDVALVRTSEGRIAARGTAARLDYRRAGGHLDANVAAMTVFPERGAQVASFGAMHFSAPTATGEVGARRGVAMGGVRFAAARGDRGTTESLEYDGETIHGEQPVRLSGPGYRVQGHGVVARADGSNVTLQNGVSGTLQADEE
jgi:hypothetical protein